MKRFLFLLPLLFLACNDGTVTNEDATVSEPEESLIPTDSIDNDRWTNSDYRTKNWDPNNGKYFFSETWTWSYENDFIPAGERGHKGKVSIDIDPVTGTMLFTKNDSHLTDEMIDFIIATPDGKYITCWTDVHGEKMMETEINQQFVELQNNQKSVIAHFKEYVRSMKNTKVFGENKYQWPTTKGHGFEMSYKKTIDKNQLYLAQIPISLLPLYQFNKRNTEVRIPIALEYGATIPKKILVLEDKYVLENKTSIIRLQSMTPSDIHMDITPYRKEG